MPRLVDRRFQAGEVQRAAAKRELDMYLDALCHDAQYSIRRACRIFEILALPKRLSRVQQIRQLERALAVRRGEQGWGRPWTEAQLIRVFYAKAGFRERPPAPVTREEIDRWQPKIPPKEQRRREAKANG